VGLTTNQRSADRASNGNSLTGEQYNPLFACLIVVVIESKTMDDNDRL